MDFQPFIEVLINLAVSLGLLSRNKSGIIQAIRADVMAQVQPILAKIEQQAELQKRDMEHLKERMQSGLDSIQEGGQLDAEDLRLIKNSLSQVLQGQDEIKKRLQKLELTH